MVMVLWGAGVWIPTIFCTRVQKTLALHCYKTVLGAERGDMLTSREVFILDDAIDEEIERPSFPPLLIEVNGVTSFERARARYALVWRHDFPRASACHTSSGEL